MVAEIVSKEQPKKSVFVIKKQTYSQSSSCDYKLSSGKVSLQLPCTRRKRRVAVKEYESLSAWRTFVERRIIVEMELQPHSRSAA